MTVALLREAWQSRWLGGSLVATLCDRRLGNRTGCTWLGSPARAHMLRTRCLATVLATRSCAALANLWVAWRRSRADGRVSGVCGWPCGGCGGTRARSTMCGTGDGWMLFRHGHGALPRGGDGLRDEIFTLYFHSLNVKRISYNFIVFRTNCQPLCRSFLPEERVNFVIAVWEF